MGKPVKISHIKNSEVYVSIIRIYLFIILFNINYNDYYDCVQFEYLTDRKVDDYCV